MLLIIDNYDSFTYNLVQYFGELGADLQIHRNDALTVDQIRDLAPTHLCISPGPGTPDDAGVSCDIIREMSGEIPIFGVCLGHQSIGQVFGGNVIRAPRLMHGKTSMVYNNGEGLFAGLDNPVEATRYHSLIVEKETLPDCLEITAWTDQDEIMGLKHKDHPTYGVQFHPESILTKQGKALVANFLNML